LHHLTSLGRVTPLECLGELHRHSPPRLGRATQAGIQLHMDDKYHPVAMSETGRTEAFSDGVLAIAVTLLMLDLHVPPRNALNEPLAVALAHEWPALPPT
jgi:hypothetical protein